MNTPLRAYAEAYIEALPKNRDAVSVFDASVEVILHTKQLRSFLADDSLAINSRRDALRAAFPDAPDELISFLSLLARDGLIGELETLQAHIRNASAAKQGKRHAIVTSAVPLESKDLTRIAASLGKKLGTDIQLEEKIDPSLLTGFLITSDGWTFDASLKGKLDRLQHALTV